MALQTYSDLIAAIPNWSDRADLASRIPEFVALAESDFNRELRTLEMEVVDQDFTLPGSEYTPAPTNLLEVREWYTNTSPRRSLTLLPADQQTGYWQFSAPPKFFSLAGRQFRLSPIPDGVYSTTLVYYSAIPSLQANNTNWLMTKHPNVYLANCQLQTAIFARDSEGIQTWAQAYQMMRDSINAAARRSRWGGSGMEVRSRGMVI